MSEYLKSLGIESVSIALVPSVATKKIKGKQYARPFAIPTHLNLTEITPVNESNIIYSDWPDPFDDSIFGVLHGINGIQIIKKSDVYRLDNPPNA